jgi:hypothetical protein
MGTDVPAIPERDAESAKCFRNSCVALPEKSIQMIS